MGRYVSLVLVLSASIACSSSEPTPSPAPDASVDAGADAPEAAAARPFPLAQTCQKVTLPEGTEEKECSECSQSFCCDTRTALVAFSDAQTLASCLAPKTCDAACEAACFAAHPAPAQALLDHGACKQYLCPSCNVAPLTACETCIQSRCTVEDLACVRDAACFVLSGCVGACNRDAACARQCETDHAAGRPALAKLALCYQSRCEAECAGR